MIPNLDELDKLMCLLATKNNPGFKPFTDYHWLEHREHFIQNEDMPRLAVKCLVCNEIIYLGELGQESFNSIFSPQADEAVITHKLFHAKDSNLLPFL